MQADELDRGRGALQRLIDRSRGDAADLRRRGGGWVEAAAAVEAVVETAERIDAILRRVAADEPTTGSRHDADESEPDGTLERE